MTALSPIPNATAPIILPDAPSRRPRTRPDRSDLAPAWAQLAAAAVSSSLIWVAVWIVLAGYLWAALPVAVLAVAVFAGAVLPDLAAARWDAQRAAQDAEEAVDA